jgi:hypothetical protein
MLRCKKRREKAGIDPVMLGSFLMSRLPPSSDWGKKVRNRRSLSTFSASDLRHPLRVICDMCIEGTSLSKIPGRHPQNNLISKFLGAFSEGDA